MDPFREIPPEIREKIIKATGSYEDARHASWASPALYSQMKLSRVPIMRVILEREPPGQLLQDMFAVMTFPGGYLDYIKKTSGEEQSENPTSANLYGNNRSEAIEKHLIRWCRKEFPKSLRGQQPDFVSEMEVYYCRLVG